MLGWLGLALVDARAGIVINEFVADPDGADSGYEWIELYNDGASPVVLTGWRLEKATSSFTTAHTFGAVTIPGHGYVLVGEDQVPGTVAVATLALGNAGSSGDALRLVDANDVVVDTVIYGPDNSDGFVDDTQSVPSATAPIASGASTARNPNGADTDAASDWIVAATPSPGGSNDATLPTCDDAAGSGVVINELQPDPAGSDTDVEWVELHNPGSSTVDLSGWAIASGTSSYNSQGNLPDGTTIGPGAFLLVGQSDLVAPDVIAPGFSLGNASNADAVQLRDCLGGVADTVAYGLDNSDGWLDDQGELARLAPKPGSGQAIGRIPDGADSDDSSLDFQVLAPTPGLSNTAPPPDCGGLGAGLVINEFLTNPTGADTDLEWVELYHAGDAVLDLEGWALEAAGTTTWSDKYTFGPGETIEPGAFLVVGGALVPEADVPLAGSLGNGSGGDGLRVVDCSGIPSDVVVYGGNNDDGVTDASGSPATSVAPTPPEGGSVQRLTDGYDSDTHHLDFAVASRPTPGASNPEITPISCEPSKGEVVINELLPDPDGSDDGLEWIELYNRGSEPQPLDGWAFSAGTSDYDDLDIRIPGGTTIAPGGFFVIGGELVDEADLVLAFSLGNGSSSRDGLRLFDCEDTVVDTVVYGAEEEDEPDEGIVDDRGEQAPSYGDPGSDQSLYRVDDGVDSDSGEDWKIGRPTPGASNVFDDSAVPAPSTGCGCGGPPDGNAPQGGPNGQAPNNAGCSTLPTQTLPLSLALVLVARRRRRQVTNLCHDARRWDDGTDAR